MLGNLYGSLSISHTQHFNGHLPGEPLLAGTPCRKRRLNLGYNLSRFILSCCIFVFDEFYVHLIVSDLVSC